MHEGETLIHCSPAIQPHINQLKHCSVRHLRHEDSVTAFVNKIGSSISTLEPFIFHILNSNIKSKSKKLCVSMLSTM